MIKRLLYGSGAAGALAAAYLLGSLTVGGAFAASPTPTSSIAPAVSQSASMGSQATPGTASRSSSTAAGTTDQGTNTAGANSQDVQPSYTSSVTTPQDQSGQSEASEDAALQSKAKITADQAKAAALGKFAGATVWSVQVENENGNVVYGVELTDSTGKAQDVKVDAGNGTVLHVEAGGADNTGAGESDGGQKAAESNG